MHSRLEIPKKCRNNATFSNISFFETLDISIISLLFLQLKILNFRHDTFLPILTHYDQRDIVTNNGFKGTILCYVIGN